MSELWPPDMVIPEQETIFSIERWLSSDLPKQYEAKKRILEQNNLLVVLPDSNLGYKDIAGSERIFPALRDIESEVLRQKEHYTKWMTRGFGDIEITPFGQSLDTIAKSLSRAIIKHYRQGRLLSGETHLTVNEDEPLWVWPELLRGDVNGELKYLINSFEKGQGKTKQQILDSQNSSFPGYFVYLREHNLYIPRVGKGKIIGGRKQIEAGMTAVEYLQAFQQEGSKGITPEDYLTLFLTRLEDSDQVLDDLEKGAACLCVGAFHETETYEPVLKRKVSHVSDGYWKKEYARATLGGAPTSERSPNFGSRPIIVVGAVPG